MARILTDTNIWLRIADPGAVQHVGAVRAVARLLSEGHEVCVCPQNLIEFWAVATRPLEANGLGRTPDEVATEITDIQTRFVLLPGMPEIFTQWKTLVQSGSIRGKRTHDARLAAVYQTHRVQALLTFNPTDFAAFPRLHLLDPMRPEDWNLPQESALP